MTDVEGFCSLQTLHFSSPWISRAHTFHPTLQGVCLVQTLAFGGFRSDREAPTRPPP